MRIHPILDRVIIKKEKSEEMTPGGLYIPSNAQKQSIFAIVLAVGEGTFSNTGVRIPLEVKVGDHVIVEEWVGQEVIFDGEKCLGVQEKSIQGIIV